ncbi:MAG: prepilin-type N-terminal cleavage/methylation domain-containing protein [Sedimentisphaerales bacterium]|nr:prepilin-type N-terminal cleavage/methylation domain-containing protein [Sedimentisphaerales bacterium]
MAEKRKNAFSLIEMLVVLVTIALLVAVAIPAINAMQKSFEATGVYGMISTAISTARTLAISNDRYTGVRFQKAYSTDPAVNTDQYMIFIISEESKKMGNLTVGFRAIEGYKPIKLPSNIGVTDMKLGVGPVGPPVGPVDITMDSDINDEIELIDASAFSIVFSPAGRLVTHLVQTRNKDGKPSGSTESDDTIFNTLLKITDPNDPKGQFVQDDPEASTPDGLSQELSRNSFVIYDNNRLKQIDPGLRYSQYLSTLPATHINAYTGEIVK